VKRPKGPELKMPELSVPPVLKDVYYDLHDRRLLPLVALVAVAIVAVPFLLGGSEELSPPATDAPAGMAPFENAEPTSLTVVEAKPGLRDYRKRLARRRPTDPFKQRYTHVDLSGAQLNPQTESSGGGAAATTTITTSGSSIGGTESSADAPAPSGGESTPPSTGSDPGGFPPSGGDADGNPDLTFYAFAIKVRIAKSGGEDPGSEKQEPTVRERVLPLTALPGEKAPVVTYMGASKKGKALLMVSNEVKSTFGDAKCISGDDVCQLLEAEPGFPIAFVYGFNEVRYTVNVLKIFPVVTGRS
jgi:hypothetical protein